MDNKLFFSIVIPAHNEEQYIADTINFLSNLDYPKDRYEVVIVENSSADKTLEIARQFEGQSIRIISSQEKGVSKARNRGMAEVRKDGDWVILLDADVLVKESFLIELNNFLVRNNNKNYVVGTTSFRPFPDSLKARIWFGIYDIAHQILKASNPPHIIKRNLLDKVKYDEQMEKAEDYKMIREARKYGSFFFFPTRLIFSSTRRFEKVGWFKLCFIWVLESVSPSWRKKHPEYKVVR